MTMWPDPSALDIARTQIAGLEAEVNGCRERIAQLEAKYGKAVAALQESADALDRCSTALFDVNEDMSCAAHGAALLARQAATTDPSATAAVEAMRAEQERQGFQGHVCDDANCQWRGFTPQPGTYVERHLAETHPNARIVVDARRGGK